MKKLYVFFSVVVIILAAVAYNFPSIYSDGGFADGYYTAEAADYYSGWKEFLTIYVNNGRIVTAEYDARNRAGFIKSWDMDYMREMNETDNNYPNQYTRTYSSELVARQGMDGIDAMSGATESFESFRLLAAAVMERARAGDTRVAFVDIGYKEH
jgi:major membrane immunogen (membrane-anchored lipoprotein)